jgi:hypothetical protein
MKKHAVKQPWIRAKAKLYTPSLRQLQSIRAVNISGGRLGFFSGEEQRNMSRGPAV